MVKKMTKTQASLSVVLGVIVWAVLGYVLAVALQAVVGLLLGKLFAAGIGETVYLMFGYLIAYITIVRLAPLPQKKKRQMMMIGLLSGWALSSFFIIQLFVGFILSAMAQMGVDFSGVDSTLFTTIVSAICYVLTLAVVIGVPWVAWKRRATQNEIGLQRLPTWGELGLAPLGFVVYLITSAVVVYLVTKFVPAFDVKQVQEIGFSQLGTRLEYILAFFILVIVAPVAEEILFRGYLYGKMQKYIPWWGAALVTSALFGLAHGQWNVAIDTFILGMFLATLRTITGSLWPSILLHMIKNGVAYYFLFINPTFINTLGG